MSDSVENLDAMVEEAFTPEAPLEANQEGHIADSLSPEGTTNDGLSSKDEGQDTSPWSINYKGKDIPLDEKKYRDYAQKGYRFEDKMHQLRVDRKLFDQERAKREAEYKELQEINSYAKENPAFEQLIQREWAKIQAGGQLEVAPEDRIHILEARLSQVLDRLDSQGKDIEARRIAEMEAKQEGAIESYKDKYSSYDWVSKDDKGMTLEDRIMQACIDKGVKDFTIMADSFLLKEHLNRKTLEGKESAAKGIQKANQLGLGKITKESQLKVKKSEDIRNKSYDDLIAEGFQELGLNI